MSTESVSGVSAHILSYALCPDSETVTADSEPPTVMVETVDTDDSDDETESPPPKPKEEVDDTPPTRPPNPPFQPIPEHKRSFRQMVCLAGMPRSGGTLLTALLGQNPKIHTEGHSPLCQLMWDTYLSYQDHCVREFASNGKNRMMPQIVGQMPHSYYQDVSACVEIVVDRCRSWSSECNMNLLRGCVDPDIKVIVMERPLVEVVESYARLLSKNHMGGVALESVLPQLLQPGKEPIVRAMEDIQRAKSQPDARRHFLFLTYDELVSSPLSTLKRVYEFCGWDVEDLHLHDTENVTMLHPEDDAVHGLKGQYWVHSRVGRRFYLGDEKVVLPEKVMEQLRALEKE